MKDFKEKLKRTPQNPGVYLMKNAERTVIYVGKAKNLKNRLTSYFTGLDSHTRKTALLVSQIDDFDYIITDTEKEALILEGNLIKKHMPRFNILLKDDKSYPYVKVTNERFPQVLKTRRVLKDGARYFGPYTNGKALNQTLDIIRQNFPIRRCGRDPNRNYEKPCFYYHIDGGVCPCTRKGENPEYDAAIQEILFYFENGFDELAIKLEGEMKRAAENMDFERAASLRDQVNALLALKAKQKVERLKDEDMDVISIAKSEEAAAYVIFLFFVRNGKILGSEKELIVSDFESSEGELIRQFLLQYYGGTPYIPNKIEISHAFEDLELFEEWLSNKKEERVHIHVPKKGVKKEVLDLAQKNAKEVLERELQEELLKRKERDFLLDSLKELLGLQAAPRRIEVYDISNIMGVYSVGAMVVFENGEKKSSDYRKFKLRTEGKPDDYHAMMEVLYRRHRRFLEETGDPGFDTLADLLLIDGGRGHVSVVKDVLKALQLPIPVAGLVKDDRHRTRAIIFEDVELPLDKHGKLYKFVASMQEEVHRFAISYHKALRAKGMFSSVLDEIEGVGEKRKQALLKAFGEIENIKRASVEELASLPEISEKVAKQIVAFFESKTG
ncbi:MAG: excinuclease ABC subunit UvrC [Bacillota bacterium]|nr:excinuclease ABC subunit UvrC [Bacillota bacterium]